MNLKLPLLVLFLCIGTLVNAQRSCGMVELMQEKMQDPEYARQYIKTQAKFKAQLALNLEARQSNRRMDPIIIPVAVHFPSGLESDRACLEALAQNQIDILNEDFNGTNADISGWDAAAPFYTSTNTTTGNTNVLFCIATMNHPTGLDPEMVEGGPAVTIGYNFGNGGETDANWAGYMNFLVKDIGGGLLGFSPFPGNIAAGESVTMNLGAFGSGAGCPNSGIVPGAPFNLGRTVTHELGHFYNLDHVFTGSCATDDNIADTPNQSNPSGGCPTLGASPACAAGEQRLFQSFMDYTDDACMIMFSNGQTTVMEAYVMSIESTFKPNVVSCSVAPDFVLAASNSSENICESTNSVNYTINYTATGGNTDTTVFSASNLPAGASGSFSPTSLSDTGTTTFTVNNLGSISAGNYMITVTGTGIVTKSIDVELIIEGATPNTPGLVSPANNATDIPLLSDLVWNTVTDATSYTVELSTNAAFTAIIASSTFNGTTFSTPELTANTQYFWRVKAANSCGESSYSATRSFTTADVTCTNYNSSENNLNIPGAGNSVHVITSTLNITDDITISDVNMTINISHTWAGDIELVLTSPNGTSVTLLANSTCDDGTNDINVTFDDQAAGPVSCSTIAPAVGGTVQPAEVLSAFNDESTVGDWVLTITDGFPTEDGGTFLNFDLEICGTTTLSVEDANLSDSLAIWPNPAKDELNVSFSTQNNKDVNIILYDLRGRVINQLTYANNGGLFNQRLHFGTLESAVYILSIENDGQIINKRIIIE
ncbi:zinc-dependent metalloprotease [Psychroserpens luteolus]|uniref:zinc-dependent metalloprotease n=1 Tax=Psychroserpens luteolus TaxID=2855840 RepID=UPI001E4DF72D|nr:proprotein convertase P-domain-containing protein [Psychroserpens luteolus]MCD2259412.1 proprotein convertase P-domain-containing protein [Psychroserpens luteolus]